jgi:hypothetical protein
MINKRLFRSALHEHADPAQRVLGATELPPGSAELARLLGADPAAEVRAAHVSLAGDRFAEFGKGQFGVRHLCATQDAHRHGRFLQIGTGQIGCGEIGANEPCPAEIGLNEHRAR